MNCPKCGQPVPEGARFCGACGTRIEKTEESSVLAADAAAYEDVPEGDTGAGASEESGHGGESLAPGEGAGGNKSMNRNKFALIGLMVLAVVLLILLNAVSCGSSSKFDQLLKTGNRYLTEMDYEQAVVVFDSAIAIEPKKAAGYVGKATAQYYLACYDEAQDTINEGLEMAEDDTSELEELLVLVQEAIAEAAASDTSSSGSHADESGGDLAAGDDSAAAGDEIYAVQEEEKVDYGYAVTDESASDPIFLNYEEIRVAPNTGDYEFQLEILNPEEDAEYEWSISGDSDDEASERKWSITQDGLLTFTTDVELGDDEDCYITESVHVFRIREGFYDGSASLQVIITTSNQNLPYYEICVLTEDSENRPRIYRFELNAGGEASLELLGSYIYYSGDVEIPDQLTVEGATYEITETDTLAFKFSSDMETLFVPAGIKALGGAEQGSNPFLYAQNLREITVDEDNTEYMSIDGVLYSKDGKTLYCYPVGRENETFTLPAQVEEIADGAFLNCRNLKEILVEEGSSHYASDDGVLINTSTKTLEVYPAGKEDEEYAIPDDVTDVEDYAFYYCTIEVLYTGGLQSLELRECLNLDEIHCGDSLKTLYIRRLKQQIQIEPGESLAQLTMYTENPGDLSMVSDLTGLTKLELWFGSYGDVDADSLQSLSNLSTLNLVYPYEKLNAAAGNARESIDVFIEELQSEISGKITQMIPNCVVSVSYYR